MIYQQLFNKVAGSRIVRTGFIGSGVFSTPMITQSAISPYINVPIIADVNIEAAKTAFIKSGFSENDIKICDSIKSAKNAIELGKKVIVEDGDILMQLPLDVIVTATRVPEAAAYFGDQAIRHGKHVVMVDKEAESVIGPILKYKADKAGVVFTTDMGDQPGLVMGMVSWARSLGFEVLCAGNIRSYDYRPETGELIKNWPGSVVKVHEKDRWAFSEIPAGEAAKYIEVRSRYTEAFSADEECGDPICHMVIASNGTGLLPDTPVGHRPSLYWNDFPEALAPEEEGGILKKRGVMEEAFQLKNPSVLNPSGSMFIIIANKDNISRNEMLHNLISNSKGTCMFISRPYHLGGAEANLSVVCAGLLGVGAAEKIYPYVDGIARAARDMKAGEVIGSSPGTLGWDHSVRCAMVPGFCLEPNNPVPFFMLSGNRLICDVSAGQIITLKMIEEPKNSYLWKLRREQDFVFFKEGANKQWI